MRNTLTHPSFRHEMVIYKVGTEKNWKNQVWEFWFEIQHRMLLHKWLKGRMLNNMLGWKFELQWSRCELNIRTVCCTYDTHVISYVEVRECWKFMLQLLRCKETYGPHAGQTVCMLYHMLELKFGPENLTSGIGCGIGCKIHIQAGYGTYGPYINHMLEGEFLGSRHAASIRTACSTSGLHMATLYHMLIGPTNTQILEVLLHSHFYSTQNWFSLLCSLSPTKVSPS